MKKKRKWLCFNSISLTVYFLASTPYYLIESAKLENFIVLATLYIVLIIVHECIIFLAVVVQWLGYIYHTRMLHVLSNLLMFVGGLFVFFSYIVIVPILLINIFSVERKQKNQL